jgi:hypothetical protein
MTTKVLLYPSLIVYRVRSTLLHSKRGFATSAQPGPAHKTQIPLTRISIFRNSGQFQFHHLFPSSSLIWMQILTYARLLAELDMASVRELEDLIIDAIYQDIVRGKLDQKAQQFEVEFTMGRDLREGQLQQLLVSLQAWYVHHHRSLTKLSYILIWLTSTGLNEQPSSSPPSTRRSTRSCQRRKLPKSHRRSTRSSGSCSSPSSRPRAKRAIMVKTGSART